MPQIDQLGESWYLASQLFWLALVFGFILIVVGYGMMPKVEATVDARDRKIADDVAAAKAARDAADEIGADWRAKSNAARADAQGLVAAAKDKAVREAEARLAEANAAIEARLASAEQEIAAARASAMAEVENVASDAAQELVGRLSGIKVTPAQAASAVKAQLNV